MSAFKCATGEDSFRSVLSILTPEEAEACGGLPAEAIAGTLQSDPTPSASTPGGKPPSGSDAASGFKPNPVFSAFMHNVIRTHGPLDQSLQQAAENQKSGYLYVIDFRTPDGIMGRVPPHDIVGAFAVNDGRIGDYQPNANHRLFTEHGLVKLPPSLAKAHIEELKRLRVQS
nr:PREDICTED: uncharacterized protein LOC109032950 [Bemisia tabaci]XP_018900858.1 PREDICTED: uncharacterized protein LOC109032950 [Bemisia tabaci]